MSERSAPRRVRVHIERLVLDGVSGYEHPADRRRLRAAVVDALETQLRERPIGTPSWTHRERERVDSIRVGHGMTAERLGTQVARSVHRGLAR